MSLGDDYDQLDALGLAALVAAREVTAAELLEEAIVRLERVNGRLNAVVQPMFERARGACGSSFGGPFVGLPFLLKDLNLSYPGVPLRMGSRFYRDHVPMEESELVRRYRNVGLNIFGKTSTPEFGLEPTTEPELHGPCRNPWDLRLSAGGSSGGSAAAVAAGVVPMASASDGGGSIRIPASCCGLFGFKPSRGRTPSGPDAPDLWHGMVAEHAITRTVRDSAALLDVVQGSYPGQLLTAPPLGGSCLDATLQPPGRLRIAVSFDPLLGRSLHPDCRTAVDATARLLDDLGHHVEEIHLPLDREQFIVDFVTVLAGEVGALLRDGERVRGRRGRRGEFEARTWGLMRLSEAFSAGDCAYALWSLQQFARRWLMALAPYDALLTSTLGAPPVAIGELRPTLRELLQLRALDFAPFARVGTGRRFLLDAGARLYDYLSQTIPANVTGQPAMSLPLHWTPAGVPIGVQIAGRPGEELVLFRLAAQLEKARPWASRRAPVWAGTDAL